jgi:hypothetical protein
MLENTLTEQMRTIGTKIDAISLKLEDKASNLRVEAVEKRAAAIEERISKLELVTAGAEAVSRFQRWALGTVGVGCLGAIATLVWLAQGGH